ncbi:hypothetical protein Taro_042543 [Colocasia esculenta]|uniref:Uncharacterized protein n=1 Tax=Colocasia esculenta TaxID=4460 RepID=A0A843WZS4_COLES|nr:hypothetical protein [Colocasia esculenta]
MWGYEPCYGNFEKPSMERDEGDVDANEEDPVFLAREDFNMRAWRLCGRPFTMEGEGGNSFPPTFCVKTVGGGDPSPPTFCVKTFAWWRLGFAPLELPLRACFCACTCTCTSHLVFMDLVLLDFFHAVSCTCTCTSHLVFMDLVLSDFFRAVSCTCICTSHLVFMDLVLSDFFRAVSCTCTCTSHLVFIDLVLSDFFRAVISTEYHSVLYLIFLEGLMPIHKHPSLAWGHLDSIFYLVFKA